MGRVLPVDAREEALAQAGARGDHADAAAGHPRAGAQRVDVFGAQDRDRVRHSLEIVEQRNLAQFELGRQPPGIDDPGQVRDLRPPVDDRASHAKAPTLDGQLHGGEEFGDDRLERRVLPALIRPLDERLVRPLL